MKTEQEKFLFGYGFFLGIIWGCLPLILLDHGYVAGIISLIACVFCRSCHHFWKEIEEDNKIH